MFFLILTIGTFTPTSVDKAEINTVCNEDGKVSFTQIILWRLQKGKDNHHRHYVSQWMMVKRWSVDRRGGRHLITWEDNGGKKYQVHASTFVSPFKTKVDFEVRDREVLPPDWRSPYSLSPFW